MSELTINMNYDKNLLNLQLRIFYTFKNTNLLVQAFSHKSTITNVYQNSYDVLKLIGENVLNTIVITYFSKKFPNETPFDIIERKNDLINTTTLVKYANYIGLNELLRVENQINKSNPKIISDIFYSLIGAIFTDSDYNNAKNVFDTIMQISKEYDVNPQLLTPHNMTTSDVNNPQLLTPHNMTTSDVKKQKLELYTTKESTNYKGLLQDYCVKSKYPIPIYMLIKSEGPDHQRVYTCRVSIGPFTSSNRFVNCDGEPASTVKQGDQNAAKKLYEQFVDCSEYVRLYLTLTSYEE